MCDTILAPPGSTANHLMLFGKNSDRQRNEAQAVELFPRADYAADTRLKCTYISIPQARRTQATLLCRPFWIWGAEMGANEHGVVVGNEGLHARRPASQEPALIGMDFVRLALERAVTAAEAVDVIITLLERHGQGGNCGHLKPGYYDNGFMIADATEAFVLETVGREWLVERVRGVHAISNAYSIGPGVERTSVGLNELLRDFGFGAVSSPSYADMLGDPQRQHIGQAFKRSAQALSLLKSAEGGLCVAHMANILRDHGPGDPTANNTWRPDAALEYGLCVHAGTEHRGGQTTGAMISEIRTQESVHWVTGTAAPCISIFKPVLMDVPLPPQGPCPTDRFDPNALWWRHERLHRAALMGDFAKFLAEIRRERDAIETGFRARVAAVLNGGDTAERAKVIVDCWKEAQAAEDCWLARLGDTSFRNTTSYHDAWLEMSRLAGMDPSTLATMAP